MKTRRASEIKRNSSNRNLNRKNGRVVNSASGAAVRTRGLNSGTKFILALMVVAAAVCIILFSNRSITSAGETGEAVQLTKYYKTITIEKGDTLWSIADEYKSSDYRTTQDYVKELREMNGLHSDQITSGQKLVVAYFAE